MSEKVQDRALVWQTSVWDGMADTYVREIDRRFAPVVDAVMARAAVAPGERVLDLGTGTGAVAEAAARITGPGGHVMAADISSQMLALARVRVESRGFGNVTL